MRALVASLRHVLFLLVCSVAMLPLGTLAYAADAQEAVLSGTLQASGTGNKTMAEPSPIAVAYSALNAPVLRADVPLAAVGEDPDPITASFAVDGMAFAFLPDGTVSLVAVERACADDPAGEGAPREVAASEDVEAALGTAAEGAEAAMEGDASGEASVAEAPADAPSAPLPVPSTVAYEGAAYEVSAIGGYAFCLSDAGSVSIPASVTHVSDDAFRSSSVASVEVDGENPAYASFDGSLWDAGLIRLQLIPEGKEGAVRIPSTAEEVDPSAFSHCALADAISVDAGSAAFASENGLLYDAELTTLLRVPAGATDITIHDGCTTVAAGSMEGCALLERISAPASVTAVSSEAQAHPLLAEEVAEASAEEPAAQLMAVVALASHEDSPAFEPASVSIALPEGADAGPWKAGGFSRIQAESMANAQEAAVFAAGGNANFFAYPRDSSPTAMPDAFVNGTEVSGKPSGQTISWDSKSNMFGPQPDTSRNYIVHYVRGNVLCMLWAERPGYTQTSWTGTLTINESYNGNNNEPNITIPAGGQFWATWAINTYSISYANLTGATMAAGPSSYTIETASFKLPTPSKPGYRFEGWDVEGAQGAGPLTSGTTTTIQKGTYGNLTCTARFTPISYSITYDLPAGATMPSAAPTTYTIESGRLTIPNPSRDAYSFTRWYAFGASGTGVSISGSSACIETGTYGNLTFSPIWNTVSYGIAYSLGSVPGATMASYEPSSYTVQSQSFDLPVPTAPLYDFVGWKVSGWKGTGPSAWGPGDAALAIGQGTYGNLQCDAQWSPKSFTITYLYDKEHGGALAGQVSSYTVESADFNLPIPTKGQYAFAGWVVTGASGTGPVASGTTTTIRKGTYGDLTCTAQWRNKQAGIFAYSRDGSGRDAYLVVEGMVTSSKLVQWNGASNMFGVAASPPYIIHYVRDGVLCTARALCDGYTQTGWEGTRAINDQTHLDPSVGNIPLIDQGQYWATWKPNVYTIEFDTQGGSELSSIQATYDADVTLPVPERVAGCSFRGWSTQADGSGKLLQAGVVLEKPNLATGGTVTLYAIWDSTISAVVPVKATVRVDLFGVEEQAAQGEEGYIESRSIDPLVVSEVSFDPEQGASELFGSRSDEVSLLAIAGEDSPVGPGDAAFSFPLDASAVESDALKLAPLRMGQSGERVTIRYRFSIPEDVMAAIDPQRFQGATTPVCAVSYTVALA